MKIHYQEERQKRLQEIEHNRQDRQSKRRQQRYQQTQNFYKSLHMLQANTLLRESDDTSPFEDYSIFLYRQQAPVFNERVKDLERKLLYPVSYCLCGLEFVLSFDILLAARKKEKLENCLINKLLIRH